MKKNTLITILVIVALIIILMVGNKNSNTGSDKLVIGAILPMTGPNAVYGEQLKYGMDYALQTLDKDHSVEIRIEDSEGQAQKGIAAFNKLLNGGADVFLPAFSRVSIPLKDLSKQADKPLIMTMVSAMSVIDADHPNAFRIFQNAETVVAAQMSVFEKKGFKKIGLIYQKDEYGESVYQNMLESAEAKGLTLIAEAYPAEQTDYRTQIQKLKAANVDAIGFLCIPPSALVTFLKQKTELGVKVPVIDIAGVAAGAGVMKLLGSASDNLYTLMTPFDTGRTGAELRAALDEKGVDKSYAAAYGHDVIKLVLTGQQNAKEKNVSLIEGLQQISNFEGFEGVYTVRDRDFQPILIPAQVVNGQFVEVK